MAVTLTPRNVGLMVATALVAGWMSASLTQSPAPAQSRNASSRRAPLGGVPAAHAERLRERLNEPPLPARGRNPFVFGARAPRPRSAGERSMELSVPETAPQPVAMPVEPPMPIFKLSGVATSTDNGATVLTAIVIDNGSMVFVKNGDKLSNGYSVVRVDELSVTIADAAGVTQTLRLP